MQIDVNFLESKNWVEQDMYERFRWLRENDPVYWSEKSEVWVITSYADVSYCSKRSSKYTTTTCCCQDPERMPFYTTSCGLKKGRGPLGQGVGREVVRRVGG